MQGAAQGVPLVGRQLTHGDSIDALMTSIRNGFPEKGMPNWRATLSDQDIKALAIFVNESRLNLPDADGRPGAEKAVWAYGFRNPEGIFFDFPTKKLWASEHGPRGGDEINLIRRGLNYGWPLFSLGVNYDGTKVDYGKSIGIEHWSMSNIVQPVIDITPSLGPSSLIVYRATKFPQWIGNIFLATMKGQALVRYDLKADGTYKRELLLRGIARILKRHTTSMLYAKHDMGTTRLASNRLFRLDNTFAL